MEWLSISAVRYYYRTAIEALISIRQMVTFDLTLETRITKKKNLSVFSAHPWRKYYSIQRGLNETLRPLKIVYYLFTVYCCKNKFSGFVINWFPFSKV